MTQLDKTHRIQGRNRTRATIYDRLNRWLGIYSRWWLLGVLLVALIASLLSFDVKPSVDGDDTSYVLSAMRIVSSGQLPLGFRTPGYPMILSLVIWIFGVNLVILKFTSLLFFLGIIFSLWIIFRPRVQPMVLSPLLLMIAINPQLLKYSSLTFSEPFFTLVLIWTIHFILRASEKESLPTTLLAAVMTMASFFVRIAGAVAGGVAGIFYIWQKRWKQLGVFALICIIMYSPMKIYEWTSGSTALGQASVLLLKDPYNVTKGTETLSGFVDRFINNAFNYLNYQIPSALGIPMPEELAFADGRFIPTASALMGVLLSTVLLIGCIAPIIAKPKSMHAFLGGFVLLYLAFISLALQNIFTSTRFVVPIIPFLFLSTLEGLRWIGNRAVKTSEGEMVSPRAKTYILIAVVGFTFANIIGTEQGIEKNYPILKANLSGNEFAGFTEDWVNYCRASRWIKTNLPIETTGIICRKPELFLLYAGNFPVYGTYKIDQTNPDSLLAKWKSLKMTHLLYDNFQWSSTLRRYIQPVAEKYPQIFELVHQEGTQDPSYIFHMNYSAFTDSLATRKVQRR